jgi:NAD(P)-dependent dehydrogenase (short-subunit alcohol dehydrogenase family)
LDEKKPLDGKTALVTGASRGIGAAIATRLAAEGAAVFVSARTLQEGDSHLEGSLQRTVETIRAAGGTAIPLTVDLSSHASREDMLAQLLAQADGVDILVNNAAAAFYKPFEDFSDKRLDIALEVNVKAPWHLCQRLGPMMRARGYGWIVNVTSHAAEFPEGAPPFSEFYQHYGMLLYGTSKSALNRFTVGLAAEYYADNIVVNAIKPKSAVLTPGMEALVDVNDPNASFEPIEAIPEAIVMMTEQDRDGINGRIVNSVDLLNEFGRTVKTLDAAGTLTDAL